MNRSAAPLGRTARWMLLACTVFGLAAMHTLGHAAMPMHTHPAHTALDTAAATDAAARMSAVTEDCAGCVHLHPGAPTPGGMDGWSVCLAVLGGLAVAVLVAACLRARQPRRDSSTGVPRIMPLAGRGPPRPAGLQLAIVSVLRI